MSNHRSRYTASAAMLFAEDLRLEETDYISDHSWRLQHPVPFDQVRVMFTESAKNPSIDGRSAAAQRLLPPTAGRHKRQTYSDVVGNDKHVRPDLWWDAPSFDIRGFSPSADACQLEISVARYFEMIDVCEAVGHEFVSNAGSRNVPRSRTLRFRREIGDPFDFDRRPFIPAIPTLLLLEPESGPATFILHSRDGGAVASAAGMRHVLGGQFQPSTRHSLSFDAEADIWLSVAREIAEELLGFDDADGSTGGRLTFESEPLASLDDMRRRDQLRGWLLGLGIDPLTLWPDLLTVIVANARAFHERFPEVATKNSEGVIIGSVSVNGLLTGFDFTAETIQEITSDEHTHPAAAACLRLAWRHRDTILNTVGFRDVV